MTSPLDRSAQNKGIIAGIAAGFFWGTPFIAPVVLSSFSSFEITFGRFLFFGLISLCSLPRIIKLLATLNRQQIFKVLILSSTGFWLYTLMLFAGIQLSNGVIASLIMGCLPLTVILFSKPQLNFSLLGGVCLILIGLTSLLVAPLLNQNLSFSGIRLSGIILLFIALFMWTWFAIQNSYFMHANQSIKSVEYSSLLGIINLAIMLPIFILFQGPSRLLAHEGLLNFLMWAMILGFGASWISNILWAYSSKHCPPSIGGALIVSETITGVTYNFIYAERLPYPHETIAILSLICGVMLVIRSQR
jgi:drug/metabolite transporter (DMT)-like permease